MLGAVHVSGGGELKVSPWWLVSSYAVITVGELCLSPMGLSLVTKLSPKRLVGLMMGGWFLSTAIGNKMSGFISGLEPGTTMFVVLAVAILAVAGFLLVFISFNWHGGGGFVGNRYFLTVYPAFAFLVRPLAVFCHGVDDPPPSAAHPRGRGAGSGDRD